jgi:hypothetical protein
MRVCQLSRLIASIALCSHGCVQLPSIGVGVRSTWRAREHPAGRTVELLTGVTIGWAGARRGARAAQVEESMRPAREGDASALGQAELPCAEAVFCRWEDDQRRAAFAREGVSDPAQGVAE